MTQQPEAENQPFRQCPLCGFSWLSRGVFLDDASVCLAGYQANFTELEAGFFLFTHKNNDCGTTFAIAVEAFLDLHDGPVFETCRRGTEACPGYCLNVHCECAFVRDVLDHISNWPKPHAAETREN